MRILIVSASVGAGHVRAAAAIEAALHAERGDIHARHVNVLDFVSPSFRRVYEGGYDLIVKRAPSVWGGVYRLTDKDTFARPETGLNRFQTSQAAPFLDLIENFRPSRIVATHFLVPQLLERTPHYWRPVHTVVTDFRAHRIWRHPGVRHYFVAGRAAEADVRDWDVPAGHISVTGIPVDPLFKPAGHAPYERLGLTSDRPVVALLGGGNGVASLDVTLRELFKLSLPLQIVSISGRNEALYRGIAKLAVPAHMTLINRGFATDMPDIVHAANIVISKAGGLTLSECLSAGKPVIAFPSLPGQEALNANEAARHGAARIAHNAAEVAASVNRLFRNTVLLSGMARCARAMGQPDAAQHVARHILRPAATLC